MRQAYLNGVIPSEQRATVLSFDSLMGSAGGVVAQPLLGRVADVSGYAASYLVAAGIQVVALPFVVLARREHAPSDPIEGTPGRCRPPGDGRLGRWPAAAAPTRIDTTSVSCWRPFSSSDLCGSVAGVDARRQGRIGRDQDLARFGQRRQPGRHIHTVAERGQVRRGAIAHGAHPGHCRCGHRRRVAATVRLALP